jgi:acyl-CoA hydrolase
MFSDGVVDLAKTGAITNRLKHVHRGRIVTSFVNGSQRVYDFVNDNPFVEFHPCDRTNDSSIIKVNDKVTAINSALEIDLSGQVVADSIGFGSTAASAGRWTSSAAPRYRKAASPSSPCLRRRPTALVSRIVPSLKPGAGVVTTRGHVHWVVTEHGVGESVRAQPAPARRRP